MVACICVFVCYYSAVNVYAQALLVAENQEKDWTRADTGLPFRHKKTSSTTISRLSPRMESGRD